MSAARRGSGRSAAEWIDRLLLLRWWALRQSDLDVLALTIAQDGHGSGIARMLVVLDVAAQLAACGDGLAVDGDDDVAAGQDRLVAELHAARARLDASLLRASRHLLDQQALLRRRDAELLLGLWAQIGQRDAGHAHLWVAVLAVLDQLWRDALHNVNRNREA